MVPHLKMQWLLCFWIFRAWTLHYGRPPKFHLHVRSMPLNHTVLIDFVCEFTSLYSSFTTICMERGSSRMQWVPTKCRSRVLDKREDICVQTTEPNLAKWLKLLIKSVTTFLSAGQARSEQELLAQGNTWLNKLGYIFKRTSIVGRVQKHF